MRLDVNSEELVKFSNNLEKIRKSAFPVVCKQTLNRAAFNTKQFTLLRRTDSVFTNRVKNFFKANSSVEMVTQVTPRFMRSQVGMTEKKLKGEHNFAIKDLEEQETGGKIDGKTFIPLNSARMGSYTTPVRPMNRLSKIAKMINAKMGKGKNKHQKFIESAVFAGVGGYVIGNENKQILFKVVSIKKSRVKLIGRSTNTVVKLRALYSVKKDRSIKVKATGFMSKSALESASKMNEYFIEYAEKQFAKVIN